MSEIAHSILGASSMYRWEACPGSVRECRGIPSTTNAASAKGTDAHDVGSNVLAARLLRREKAEFEFPDNFTVEDRKAVELYVDTVSTDYLEKSGASQYPASPFTASPGDWILIEQHLDLSSVYPGCFGTADAVSWASALRLLRVYDYKHGTGVVEVEANRQLLYYALGAFLKARVPAKWIEAVIVQPRAKHRNGQVRRWRFPSIMLMDFREELLQAAQATEDPKAPLVLGRHCFFCPAKTTCPARRDKAVETAQNEFQPIEDNPFEENNPFA